MRFLMRTVLAFSAGTCTQDDLLALVAPVGLVEAMATVGSGIDDGDESVDDPKTGGSKIANASLGALRRLGLVQVDGGLVTATETAISTWRAPKDVTARSFARRVRRS